MFRDPNKNLSLESLTLSQKLEIIAKDIAENRKMYDLALYAIGPFASFDVELLRDQKIILLLAKEKIRILPFYIDNNDVCEKMDDFKDIALPSCIINLLADIGNPKAILQTIGYLDQIYKCSSYLIYDISEPAVKNLLENLYNQITNYKKTEKIVVNVPIHWKTVFGLSVLIGVLICLLFIRYYMILIAILIVFFIGLYQYKNDQFYERISAQILLFDSK